MELINATGMPAGYTLGLQPDGRELVVVVVKGTFVIPDGDGEPAFAEKQVPICLADEYAGAPGMSALLVESDYVPRKPRCDVILNGSAYAPGGEPAARVPVSLRVGPIAKSFMVVGDRVWKNGFLSVKASDPKPFLRMPITYEIAFGGEDQTEIDPKNPRIFPGNPIGKGFHNPRKGDLFVGRPLPNTEELDRPVTEPHQQYRPMSFGAVGRNFQSRVALAGTYDHAWLDNTFPFLPADFDEAFYQSAPADQQMPYPEGGEVVTLVNLSPRQVFAFSLPKIEVPVEFTRKSWERVENQAVVDTIVIEPDEQRFTMTWRASLPLKRNIFEVSQAVAGRMPRGWYRAREMGKTYYPSLGELVASQARTR